MKIYHDIPTKLLQEYPKAKEGAKKQMAMKLGLELLKAGRIEFREGETSDPITTRINAKLKE